MESIHNQPDQGMRTSDFFDDTTDDDASTKAAGLDDKSEKIDSPKSPSAYLGGQPAEDYVSHCKDDEPSPSKSSSPVIQGMDGFLRLTQTPGPKHKHWPRPPERPARPEITIEDVDAVDWSEDVPIIALARPLSMHRPSSGHIVKNQGMPAAIGEKVEDATAVAAIEAAKDELIINAHTQTLQALLRDETALQHVATRISFGTEPDLKYPVRSSTKKRVSLAPLPLDIPHGHLPDDLVRTPYPLSFRKILTRPSPTRASVNMEHDAILPLTIRRCGSHSHRPQRITHITLPADAVAAGKLDIMQASPATKDKHFESLDWDDAHLFAQLRTSYHTLAGPYRFFSARSLQSIQLSHSNDSPTSTRHDENSYFGQTSSCQHTLPCSPRFLESKGLTDSFSEQELLKHFGKPKLGRSRYAWVHWAKRIASCPGHLQGSTLDPPADSPAARLAKVKESVKDIEEKEDNKAYLYTNCAANLEFVEGYSWRRILVAFVLVNALAVAAAVCWILLGTNLQPYETGYSNGGERVPGGAVLGVFVLLTGWTWVGGWVVVSSLVG
jgi:hypothetical protein